LLLLVAFKGQEKGNINYPECHDLKPKAHSIEVWDIAASGVVFTGDNEGNFMAFDATTGKNLWFYPTCASIWGAAAMSYMLDLRQYVVIGSGTNVSAFTLPPS
jgi:outer membrane protein assembly factor BamB